MTTKEPAALAKDPICGMTVSEETALHLERDGKHFYFCGDACREKFLAMPSEAKAEGDAGCCCG